MNLNSMKKGNKHTPKIVINNPNQAYYRQFEVSLKNLNLNESDQPPKQADRTHSNNSFVVQLTF